MAGSIAYREIKEAFWSRIIKARFNGQILCPFFNVHITRRQDYWLHFKNFWNKVFSLRVILVTNSPPRFWSNEVIFE